MWAAWLLLGCRPLKVSLTVSVLPERVRCAVPLAVSLALDLGAALSGTCTDIIFAGEIFVKVRSLQTIGKNWSAGASPGPLWTVMYHPLAGRVVTFLITVVDDPTPCASATIFCRGSTTAPCFAQLPA